jgi:hypothetical protein
MLAFKAGRALRRGGTNFVDPSPEKGAIILYQGDDDLMHFIWKNRTTNAVEEVKTHLFSFTQNNGFFFFILFLIIGKTKQKIWGGV